MASMKHISIGLLVLLAGLLIPARAQNNPYKIDDSLYPLYQRATKWRVYPQGLLMADTLYAEAVKRKDKKAECIALTIPVYYYYAGNDFDLLRQAATKLKEKARKNDYLQYYYFAWTNEINWSLNHGNTLRALRLAEEMKEQAFKDQHEYGIFSCIRILGNIYRLRRNEELSMTYYRKALDYMLEHLPEQDPAPLYQNLVRYYRGKQVPDYPKALALAEKGLKEAKNPRSRIGVMLEKCQVLYRMRRIDEFNACYDECMSWIKHNGVVQNELLKRVCVYKFILDKEYEKAYSVADSVGNSLESIRLRGEISLRVGDYEKAYINYFIYHNYLDSINRQVQFSDLAELNAQIDNERMKQEAQALEFKNTELSLQNTQLELEQTKSSAELEKMNAENSKLVLENRNLELARLNVEAERQKAILKEQQIVSRHHIMMLSLVLSFFFLFTCLLIFYLYKRRKSMIALREKNDELVIARDRAEESDKMKMVFIQNMSHEIRTPLNAIVGFSQIIASPDVAIGEEEKKEFSMLIQHNSELLTTLVNDVLDLASLESGKYNMNLVPRRCNDLCRMAMASVKHRKPDEVKLYFTTDAADDFQFITDEKRFQQVLVNFLTNAEKHTEKGEIHLSCSLAENPGRITFAVADTGPGVPDDKIDTIFERFNKLDEFKQGTGLGLNICRLISERLNGEVKLDKNYTAGARFVFILPLK